MIRFLVTAVGLLAILALTLEIFGLPVGHSLALLAQGAFGDKLAITRTLVKWIPLVLTGLGIVVAWRAGMYNIGGEGQFVVGGLAGCLAAFPLIHSDLGWIGIIAILLAATLGGALWGGFAGWLKVSRGVDVVIATILLNFVAIQLLGWAVTGPLKDSTSGVPLTPELPSSFMLPRLDRQTDLHAGLFVAMVMVGAIYLFLYLSAAGFQMRLVGEGERAARANRIDAHAVRLRAMLISGGLCGLAGGVEYLGIAGQLGASFAQGWGFLAIPVALLGGLHPLWVAVSALYFGALLAGSRNLEGFTAQGTTVVYIIQAAAVLGLIALRSLRSKPPVPAEAGG